MQNTSMHSLSIADDEKANPSSYPNVFAMWSSHSSHQEPRTDESHSISSKEGTDSVTEGPSDEESSDSGDPTEDPLFIPDDDETIEKEGKVPCPTLPLIMEEQARVFGDDAELISKYKLVDVDGLYQTTEGKGRYRAQRMLLPGEKTR
eukprot:GHVU01189851.1.p1 GENE.GHVU01189851.1~~GHVU01189851.1.p1  ORF type:complete len:148 (-),score=22.18 GHVU01189851.1:30-473(-)